MASVIIDNHSLQTPKMLMVVCYPCDEIVILRVTVYRFPYVTCVARVRRIVLRSGNGFSDMFSQPFTILKLPGRMSGSLFIKGEPNQHEMINIWIYRCLEVK